MAASQYGSEITYHPHTVEVISSATPSENELKENEALKKFLRARRLYESADEYANRVEVLNLMLELVRKWVKTVAQRRGMSELEIEDANANFYSFGSFRLNSHGPGVRGSGGFRFDLTLLKGDDIDTHCVGPAWCDRKEDFFGQQEWCLEHLLASQAWVSSLQAVPDAYVPVLKLVVRGIDIDLTYAQLPLREVPESLDLQDNKLLRGMDETSVTSINGCRVTDKIVRLVQGGDPSKDLTHFQDALRYLKYWGKRRGIYSNVMGFLGGVNFAILMARVCLHYPNACASTLVRNFFKLMFNWSWGDLPFQITGVHRGGPWKGKVWEKRRAASWDPVRGQMLHSSEVFPILTPCYPTSNSTYNVSECTKAIMLAEFKRGYDMARARRVKSGEHLDFAVLSQPAGFLGPHGFRNYLQITAAASSREDFTKWKGFINAQVKRLFAKIHSSQGLVARPWPEEFSVPMEYCEDGRLRVCWLVGLRLLHAAPQNGSSGARRVDFRTAIHDWQSRALGWAGHAAGMTVEFAQLTAEKLPEWLTPRIQEDTAELKAIAAAQSAAEGADVEAAEAGAMQRETAADGLRDGGDRSGTAGRTTVPAGDASAVPSPKRPRPAEVHDAVLPAVKRGREASADAVGGAPVAPALAQATCGPTVQDSRQSATTTTTTM